VTPRPTISTHVLDTGRGEPAGGVRVELYRDESLLSSQETDADGRIADLVQGELLAGTYRLVFQPPSPFFTRVELELSVDDASRHLHVPLLVSPYSCASYRGS
jgi:5-hydroxyisourate hydrolase